MCIKRPDIRLERENLWKGEKGCGWRRSLNLRYEEGLPFSWNSRQETRRVPGKWVAPYCTAQERRSSCENMCGGRREMRQLCGMDQPPQTLSSGFFLHSKSRVSHLVALTKHWACKQKLHYIEQASSWEVLSSIQYDLINQLSPIASIFLMPSTYTYNSCECIQRSCCDNVQKDHHSMVTCGWFV